MEEKRSLNLQKRRVEELNFYKGNPRKISPEILEKLKRSIQEFGYVDPLIINTKNEVIGGNQRLKVLRELGIDEVECVVVDLPKSKEKALNLALNKIQGEWDWELLKDFISDIEMPDFELTGFDEEEIADIIFEEEQEEGVIEEEPFVPEDVASRVKEGDIWVLGEHRLICGDSFNKETLDKLLEGDKVDMIFTDPPYGISLDTDFSGMKGFGRGKKYKKVINDDKEFDPSFFIEFFSYCKEQFWWGADYYAEKIKDRNKGSWFVWDKTGGGESPNSAYEKQFGSNFELCWSKNRHKRNIIRVLWKGIFGLSEEDTKKRVHPTQKPVRLCSWFIEKFSKKDDIVLDLFGGSGSTLIACEQHKRRCRIMELDPSYCDIILARWENISGSKAEKLVL